MKNRTMMQFFEWYLPEDCAHWRRTCLEAEKLAADGVNMATTPSPLSHTPSFWWQSYGYSERICIERRFT